MSNPKRSRKPKSSPATKPARRKPLSKTASKPKTRTKQPPAAAALPAATARALAAQPIAAVNEASDAIAAAPLASPARHTPTYRVLSLDGGGIRGLMTAIWLRELRNRLGSPLRDHFHLIAGTSTGSILACLVASGREPDEIIALYRDKGESIFPGLGGRLWSRFTRLLSDGLSAPRYDAQGLYEALRATFGTQLFGDLPSNTMVLAYDTEERATRVFKSWRMDHDERERPVWEIVAASCSAPTYFPAFPLTVNGKRRSLIDGGVSANNPCACAVAEAVRLNCDGDSTPAALPGLIVASFGTGQVTRPIPYESAREWGAIEWALPIIDVLMDGSGDATSYIVQQLVGEHGYFRFNTELTQAYDDMDNASPINLNALETLASTYIASQPAARRMAQLTTLLTTTERV